MGRKNGFNGMSTFLYGHSDEERTHMLKLFHYIMTERSCLVPTISGREEFQRDQRNLSKILHHEQGVSKEINSLVDACLNEKDYATHNFLQWYVSEQIEEERLAQTLLDRLDLIGSDKGGLYLFDRDLESFVPDSDSNA